MGKKTDICTIYKLTNVINGKFYIGQTWRTLEDRIGSNGAGYKNCSYLYAAIKKYGIDNFEYSELLTCNTQEEADFYETTYIEEMDARNAEIAYNLKGGGNVSIFTEESLKKMSENNARYFLGLPCSEERKKNISEAKKKQGLKLTEAQKKAVSDGLKRFYKENKNPNLGRKISEETKKKISESNKGRIISKEELSKRQETIDSKRNLESEQKIMKDYFDYKEIQYICEKYDISAPKLYRILKKNNKEKREIKISDSTKEKIRIGNTGKKDSPETIAKKIAYQESLRDLELEKKVIQDYLNQIGVIDICNKYQIHSPRMYTILEKNNISLIRPHDDSSKYDENNGGWKHDKKKDSK